MSTTPRAGRGRPPQPTVAVGGIAFDDAGRVLLVRRAQAPSAGRYSIPGGRVEPGETLRAACARELAEETGLVVAVGPLVEVIERIGLDPASQLAYHYVILDYLVRITGGELRAGTDAALVVWVALDELDRLPTTGGLRPVIEKARALAAAP